VAEVAARTPVSRWTRVLVEEMLTDLDAGATYVIAEGRESGTVGVYDSAASRARN